jgi:valyl-tRNA synthetase
MRIPPSQKVAVILHCSNAKDSELLNCHKNYLLQLARVSEVTFSTSRKRPKAAATAIVKGIEIYVPLAGLIDFGEEERRLKKEIEKTEKELALVQRKLSNEDFLRKAPREIVEKENQVNLALVEKQKKLKQGITRLMEMKDLSA